MLQDDQVGIGPQNFCFQIFFKPAHDRQYDDQGHHPKPHPGHGEEGDHRDEDLFALGL